MNVFKPSYKSYLVILLSFTSLVLKSQQDSAVFKPSIDSSVVQVEQHIDSVLKITKADSLEVKLEEVSDGEGVDEDVIKDQKGVMNLNILDSILPDYNVYLNGENHTWYDDNGVVKFEMLKYLNEKAGVTRYFMEFGPTTGWIINEYVMDKDTALGVIFNMLPNGSYKTLFENIRDHNRTLPDSLKIGVIGVDAQKLASMLILYVDYLRRGKDVLTAHDSIQLSLEALHYDVGNINHFEPNFDNQRTYYNRQRYKYDNKKMETIINFQTNYNRFKSAYNSFFGADSVKLKEVMATLEDYRDYEDYTDNSKPYLDIFREREMIRRMKNDKLIYPNAKYFGQFGKCHISKVYAEELCQRYNFTCFADRMDNDSMFDVLKLGITYKVDGDAEYMSDTMQAQFNAFNKEGLDSIKIVKYESVDSLRSEPDFVLFNPQVDFSKKSTKKSDDKKKKITWVDSWMLHYNFNFEYGNIYLDQTDAFSFDLSPTEKLDIPSDITTIGFSYKYIADEVFYFNVDYRGRMLDKFNVNDSLEVAFRSFQSSFTFGYEFFPTSLINLSPYGGLGFGSSSLAFDYDNETDFVIGSNDFVVTNDIYLLDAGLDLDFTLGFFNFGARGGYQFDISKKEWANEGTGKQTSFTGFYWTAFAGLTLLIE